MVVAAKKTKWDVKREASYEALLRSAMLSFHTRGYAATTVDNIVAGTGYSSGAFYFHFTNKTDCFWHVLAYRERVRGDWSRLAANLDPTTTSLEEVLGRVFTHFEASLEGVTAWVLVMVDFHQQHRSDEEARAKLAESYRRWRNELATFISVLQAGGWISMERDPEVVAQQVFAYAEGVTVHTALYGLDNATLQQAFIDGLTRLLRG